MALDENLPVSTWALGPLLSDKETISLFPKIKSFGFDAGGNSSEDPSLIGYCLV